MRPFSACYRADYRRIIRRIIADYKEFYMPRKPKRPCAYPGCPNLTHGTYCEQHQIQARRQYDQYRRPADTAKKYGRAWHRIRARYAAAHPLCERCLQEGKLTPVEEVHHIVPVSRGGTHAEENLMSLCQSCHNRIHHEMGDR
jgi:5-methylcytosine-specific restriction protein A